LLGHIVKPKKKHSAWSESSAAYPRPRGGHRKGEKVARGAYATLQRRDPQGEPTSGLCFGAKVPKDTNGEARRAELMHWLW